MGLRRNGFTLIELLVVIAIIALLLAIMMPALEKAKAIARDVICRTNIKSMTLATILYTQDTEGKMMEHDWPGAVQLWVKQISHYLENVDEARYCPNTKLRNGSGGGSANTTWGWNIETDPGVWEVEHGSYGINGWFYKYDTAPVWAASVPISNFIQKRYEDVVSAKSPYLAPIFADSEWPDAWPQDIDTCPDDFNLDGNHDYGGFMSRYLLNRHGNHTNVGFIDGHQAPIKLEMLWTLKWNAQFKNMGVMKRTDGSPVYQK